MNHYLNDLNQISKLGVTFIVALRYARILLFLFETSMSLFRSLILSLARLSNFDAKAFTLTTDINQFLRR
jgi:hypothetical protein